jgi:hypothetical protein
MCCSVFKLVLEVKGSGGCGCGEIEAMVGASCRCEMEEDSLCPPASFENEYFKVDARDLSQMWQLNGLSNSGLGGIISV